MNRSPGNEMTIRCAGRLTMLTVAPDGASVAIGIAKEGKASALTPA
jgi:hypothetical protein